MVRYGVNPCIISTYANFLCQSEYPIRLSLTHLNSIGSIKLITEAVADDKNFATFGLSTEWEAAYNWACAHQVWDILIDLIDVAMVQSVPKTYRWQVLGSLLTVIARPTSRYLFSKWTSHSIHANALSQLSEAIALDRSILISYPSCGYEYPAKHYLKGKLDPLYLAAVCVARPPVPNINIQEHHIRWYETLIAWLLVGAHVANEKGFRQDAFLHRVCTKLRIASDEDRFDVLMLASQVSRPVESCGLLPEFEQTLIYRTQNLCKGKDLSREVQYFFDAIIEVARHNQRELNLGDVAFSQPKIVGVVGGNMSARTKVVPDTEEVLDADVDSGLPAATLLPGESNEDSAKKIPATEPTQLFQRLTGNSILLASAEELHFLPWSWTTPTEIERQSISKRIEELLASDRFPEQLLGAVILLAEYTARSLLRVLQLGINSYTETEWSWIPAEQRLVRYSRRRSSGWSPKTVAERKWVRNETVTQSISLPEPLRKILDTALQLVPQAKCIGDIWVVVNAISPEVALNKAFSEACPRLSPGMLGRTLGASLQTITRDSTLAKLATSHPKSALPGACAYASWTSRQLQDALLATEVNFPDGDAQFADDDSALGSLLVVIEGLLPHAFETAAFQVNQLRQALTASESSPSTKSLIDFHNSFVAYVVVQLLAATGARPVKDPFESPNDFCFQWHFLYVEDKAQVGSNNGRLVPVPSDLSNYIDTIFRAHLANLSRILAPTQPILASEIEKLVANTKSHSLPFFFLLRYEDTGLVWDSVSEYAIKNLNIFEWPLPLNFFRHRLANRLRDLGVDVEIIDGLLGHGESGAESYGDESWRNWKTDVDAAEGVIASAFAQLETPWLSGLPDALLPITENQTPLTEPPIGESRFGRIAREKRRVDWKREAKSDATFHRRQLLAGKKLEELTSEDLDKFSLALLLNEKNMPHARGWFKYQRFLEVLERHGQITGRRYRPKNHYIQCVSANSFTELAPRSATTFEILASQLDAILKGTRHNSYQQAALYASLLLCTESRIADQKHLMAALRSEGYRVLRLDGKYYVEFAAEIQSDDPDMVVRRHRISVNAARLLQYAQTRTTKARDSAPAIPIALSDFAVTIANIVHSKIDDCHELLHAVAKLTDQWNVMTLPGVVAGYLAGRNDSWSLPARFWSHQLKGFPLNFPDIDLNETESDAGEAIVIRRQTVDSATAQVAAADKFFREFRKALHNYKDGGSAELDTSDNVNGSDNSGRPSRRNLRRALIRMIDSWSGNVSPTLLLVAKWITPNVTRKHNGRYIAISTLFRYLTALSRPFADAAFNVDIRLLQEDDLTDLYGIILQAGKLKRAHYRYERLRAFQRWCEIHHEVARPNWSDLPHYDAAMPADAGIILEADYLGALTSLISEARSEFREDLAPAMLLLVCYRFALRPKEAFGLRRDEWLDLGLKILIIVQTNNIRPTKVPVSSRRVVPLVFDLMEVERELLKKWFGALVAIGGDQRGLPIFCDETGVWLDLERVSVRARATLKRVTGNTEVVLYHARHTAGSAVALALADVEIPGSTGLPGVSSSKWRERVQTLLLGYSGVSRRSPWALARYFGHMRTERARSSYLHFFGDWADSLIWGNAKTSSTKRSIDGIFDLDALPPLERPPAPVASDVGNLRYTPSLVGVLQFLRLLGRGYPANEAGNRLSMPTHVASDWGNFVDTVDRRLYFAIEPLVEKDKESTRFLGHLTEDAWQRLLSLAATISSEFISATFGKSGVRTVDVRSIGLSMIGATRQWTMWTTEHLTMLRILLDLWSISTDQQRIVGPLKAIAGSDFDRLALDLKFDIKAPDHDASKAAIKIDAGMEFKNEGRELHNFGRRCAFLIEEMHDRHIRNSFEWLVACVAVLLFVPTHAQSIIKTESSSKDNIGAVENKV